MSQIKDLKENPKNNINLVEVISKIWPDLKPKYIDLIVRVFNNRIERLETNIGFYKTKFPGMTEFDIQKAGSLEIMVIANLIETLTPNEDWDIFQKFSDYNERSLITNNNLSKINDLAVVFKLVTEVEDKVFYKDMEKQIKTLYEDNEWLILRPLTHLASKKYGASTKWCTAGTNAENTFISYTSNGILIYVINKMSKLKVAAHKYLTPESSVIFYNVVDKQIDSMETGIPFDLLKIIHSEINTNPQSNISLLPEKYKKPTSTPAEHFGPINGLSGTSGTSGIGRPFNKSIKDHETLLRRFDDILENIKEDTHNETLGVQTKDFTIRDDNMESDTKLPKSELRMPVSPITHTPLFSSWKNMFESIFREGHS